MAKPDDIEKLPLPKSWPRLARRALVLVNSMLKTPFDIELGRRLDCASRHAREHADHERLRLDSDSDREALVLYDRIACRRSALRSASDARPEGPRALRSYSSSRRSMAGQLCKQLNAFSSTRRPFAAG